MFLDKFTDCEKKKQPNLCTQSLQLERKLPFLVTALCNSVTSGGISGGSPQILIAFAIILIMWISMGKISGTRIPGILHNTRSHPKILMGFFCLRSLNNSERSCQAESAKLPWLCTLTVSLTVYCLRRQKGKHYWIICPERGESRTRGTRANSGEVIKSRWQSTQ